MVIIEESVVIVIIEESVIMEDSVVMDWFCGRKKGKQR